MASLDAFMESIRPCFLHVYSLIAYVLHKDPPLIAKDIIRNGLIVKVLGTLNIPSSHDFLVALISNNWSVYQGLSSLPEEIHSRLMHHLQAIRLFDILAEFINGKQQKLNEKLFDFIVNSAALSLYDDDKIILSKIEDKQVKLEIESKLTSLRNYQALDSFVIGAQRTFDTILEAIFNKDSNLHLTAKQVLLSQFLSSSAFLTVAKLYAQRIIEKKRVGHGLRLGTVINKILRYMKFYKEQLHKLSESMKYLMIHTQISIEYSFGKPGGGMPVKLMLTETFKLLLGLYGQMFEMVKKDTWSFFVQEFFKPGSAPFHSQFMQILALCFNRRHERSLINIFVVQNLFQPLYRYLKDAKTREMELDLLGQMFLVITSSLEEFEGELGFEGLSGQMRCSHFWKKLKELRAEYDHWEEEDALAYKYGIDVLLKRNETGSAQSGSPHTRRDSMGRNDYGRSTGNLPIKRFSTHVDITVPNFKFKGGAV